MDDNKTKVIVYGTEYVVYEIENMMPEKDGETDFYEKIIHVRKHNQMLEEGELGWKKQCRQKEVLRHEIIHAMLYECGLEEYAYDEILVQWIASQFPKMKNMFNSMRCAE